MDRVLLLDASFAARPIHDWLTEQGFDTWTIGNRPSDVLAMRNPSKYIQDDYSNLEVVQNHINRLKIEYVVPGCTDVSIEVAQRLCGLGTKYDQPEVYEQLADKAAFRNLCSRLALNAPKIIDVKDLPRDGLIIVKPTDSYSGRGVSVFDARDAHATKLAFENAVSESRNGKALLETYVQGQLYSYSCFLSDCRVTEGTIVKEDGAISRYTVDTSHVVSDFSQTGLNFLRNDIEKLASELNLVDGLLHVQFIWDGQCPWLIELTRRCPGDLYPRLIELSTGIPFAAKYTSYFVKRTIPEAKRVTRHILRHTVNAGHIPFEGVWFDEIAPMIEYHPIAKIGREEPSPNIVDRVAVMFLEYNSNDALIKSHFKFLKKVSYRTKCTF